ncbi:MAG: sigma-54-dependent Fis family transcriptional regulator [Gammaproteobacteria bacterium]|nr:sigma-54-dependent Fis family transcriptional regulator [Gammaproteobacteria bacterium]
MTGSNTGSAHVSRIYDSISNDHASSQLDTLVLRSWQRCVKDYDLDPARASRPHILTATRLKDYRDPLGRFLSIARRGIMQLFKQIADLGYVILLTDVNGVTVDYLGHPSFESELKRCGLYLGSVWAEQHEGTNGVGTCIQEQKPLTIHRNEHFRSPHITLTCTVAPIFDPFGKLLAVLDVSSMSSPPSKASQHLALQLVKMYATMIENANFLANFEQEWVVQLKTNEDLNDATSEMLIALTGDGKILAANTAARKTFQDNFQNKDEFNECFDDISMLSFEQIVAHSSSHPGIVLPVRLVKRNNVVYATLRAPVQKHNVLPFIQNRVRSSVIHPGLEKLGGSDPVMIDIVQRIRRIENSDIHILLAGETGTGKEALARAIHDTSNRRNKAFVVVNCAALPDNAIERELFGNDLGLKVDANCNGKVGKILQSDGATLFLDEISDMPLYLQSRLLRVIAEKEVISLEGDGSTPVDLHIVSATHANIEEMVNAGEFRDDLYYRLNGVTMTLPRLRERKDKRELIQSVFGIEQQTNQINTMAVDDGVLALLTDYEWPGNIRQLRNVVRYMLAVSNSESIQLEDLPNEIRTPHIAGIPAESRPVTGFSRIRNEVQTDVSAKDKVLASLQKCNWVVTDAALDLGVSRMTVYRHMKKWGISREP